MLCFCGSTLLFWRGAESGAWVLADFRGSGLALQSADQSERPRRVSKLSSAGEDAHGEHGRTELMQGTRAASTLEVLNPSLDKCKFMTWVADGS
jgi:hypothetical protein